MLITDTKGDVRGAVGREKYVMNFFVSYGGKLFLHIRQLDGSIANRYDGNVFICSQGLHSSVNSDRYPGSTSQTICVQEKF